MCVINMYMASLFGKHRIKELAETIKTEEVQEFIELVKTWHNDYYHGSLKTDKETSREQAYNQDFFIKILGYKEKPAIPYSLEPKATTDKGQLPDSVLGYTDQDKDIKNIAAVVELKGASIDLDRPQRRDGNFSPVQQGFKYKTQYRNCPFVVVSNFFEFRLYRDNLLDYEAWTLDDLVNPENDYQLFKTWYLLLQVNNFTSSSGVSKTEGLLTDIRVEQEEIGKKFYKVYRDARLELLRDIYRNNPEVKKNIEFGIEKAQKIIDRVVFTCFAEDKGLLPENTLVRVLKAGESSAFGGSLWNTLKGFFEAIDVGSEKLDIPDGYNGGLFKHDSELNNLKIGDSPLRTVLSLGTYNFEDDLSVTILGHIFEQSISDLEEIKNKVNESQDIDTIVQSRRKKDGIFYTPDYIVRYIVDNSLGSYLREHEEKFKDEFKLKGDINDVTYEKREQQVYEKYQQFLENVKVLDPACGSGAFLVYVFDYLMAENKRVASIRGTLFNNDQYIRSILKNNIFGVDLNEESVEITKLSLWLKSAEKGKKLTSLDKNIKCGNSLISDIKVAGIKSFNWNDEFSEIIDAGGFDIIVGNPPYVRLQSIKSNNAEDIPYYESVYKTARGRFDLYVLFIEKAIRLLSDEGKVSYILPHKFLGSNFGAATRKYLSEGRYLEKLVHFGSYKVFEDASTYTCILSLSHNNNCVRYLSTNPIENISESDFIDVPYSNLSEENWIFTDMQTSNLLNKITSQKTKLNDAFSRISRGVVTGADGVFILKGNIQDGFLKAYSKELNAEVAIEESIVQPILMGGSVSKNIISTENLYLIYPHKLNSIGKTVPFSEEELSTNFPKAYAYLAGFRTLLTEKKVKYKSNTEYWYALHNSREISVFVNKKIISPYLALKPNMAVDKSHHFTNDKCTNLILKGKDQELDNTYFAILNSKLMQYYMAKTSSEFSGGYFAYTNVYLEPFSFPEIKKKFTESISDKIELLQEHSKRQNALTSKFKTLIEAEYDLNAWPTKAMLWWDFNFEDFIKVLKLKISLSQKDELHDLYLKYKEEITSLTSRINTSNSEIDNEIYEIYDLSPEEIAKIEDFERKPKNYAA
jgi:type I restriction-modification system DNA methylase subunit